MCSKGYALACLIHDLIFPLVTSHTIFIKTDSFYLVHTIQIHCLYNIITHVPVGEGVTTYRNKTGSLSTTHVLHPHSIFTPSHLTHEIFVRPMSWMDEFPVGGRGLITNRASHYIPLLKGRHHFIYYHTIGWSSVTTPHYYMHVVLRNHTPLLHVVLRNHTHYYMTTYYYSHQV